jgi:septal ring factor EnvC (AmiA/AmiB activator)
MTPGRVMCFVWSALLAAGVALSADEQTELRRSSQSLEQMRGRIEALDRELAQSRGRRDALMQEMESAERRLEELKQALAERRTLTAAKTATLRKTRGERAVP